MTDDSSEKLPAESASAASEQVEGEISENRGGVIVQKTATLIVRKGALPPPEEFNAYPESAQELLMESVRKEIEYRHLIVKRGQIYTFATVVITVLISAILVLNGHPYGLIILVGIIPALGAFLARLKDLFHSKGGDS